MNVCLLYRDKDWNNVERYFDDRAIVQDLGLETLFLASAKALEIEDEKVKSIRDADLFLKETMKKVMCVPLTTEEEIVYRQQIMQDFIWNVNLADRLYDITGAMLDKWEKLGRRVGAKAGNRNSPRVLLTEIHVLQLFVATLRQIKECFFVCEEKLKSEGLRTFYDRLCMEFSDKVEDNLTKILEDISFFANENESNASTGQGRLVNKPMLVMNCGVGEGLKFADFSLEELTTQKKKHKNPNGTFSRAQNYISNITTDSFTIKKDMDIESQVGEMEYRVVQYIMSYTTSFISAFNSFFDQLHLQVAFYKAALNLKQYMDRFYIANCFPTVCGKRDLRFRELRELVMGIEQRINPVGNTCEIKDKNLLIVTGANQGGKSTFLRSIGIAQVMMQCGLPVAAEMYESGIFPSFFTHFTRREDAEMNSGRLDEELGRMSKIIDNLGENSIVLLNESFATTTEKEGSVIAYDIIKAMTEAGVKVLTVTHLLSFARKVYGESEGNPQAGVEFLSAQRKEDGARTFKMVQHAPELTSFGLDLYNEIIRQKK